MPATPSQLRQPVVVTHTVSFATGAEVAFTFDRNKLTDAWMNEWTRLEGEKAANQMNGMLDDLIMGWDVLNDDGTPYPKSPDTIGYLFALPDKALIFEELLEASVPSRAEGNDSSEPRSTQPGDSTPPEQTPLNGQAPSASLEPSASPSLT